MTKQSGLYAGADVKIPLKGVKIDVRVSGLCSEVTVAQRYVNEEEIDVEAVYVFPLEEGAAVAGFSAKVGDRVVEGRVEGREEAFEIYDDAMADGHGAFLLDQERPNIFTASIGNIRPKSEVEVSIKYVAMLNFDGPVVRLMLPTTVSPRYTPVGQAPEVGEPDAERVNPPRVGSVPYGLNLKVDIDTPRLKSIESPSHTVRTTFEDDGAMVELSSQSVALDRDFVLLIKPRDAHTPIGRVAREDDGTRVAMVTFYPDPDSFETKPKEVHFLLDCSGSMHGDSIDQAKRALALCVRALSEGDTFNITCFGSRHTSLWPQAKRYEQGTLDEATTYIERADADMGGTEILTPMREILGAKLEESRPRDVLLLTDGEVSNEDAVIALCKERAKTARVFSFGIGAGASEHLVRGVARASRGAAEFIFPGERIEPKVLRMFNRVGTPAMADVRVNWGTMEVEQAPRDVPPVFAEESVTLFARVRSGNANSVTLRAGDKSWSVAVDPERAESGGPIPCLWARHAIRDVEEGKLRRGSNQGRGRTDRRAERLVELGKRYGLLSSATSYVAVEVRPEGERSTDQAELRRIPIALTAGWGGQGSVLGNQHLTRSGAVPPPMSMPRPPAPMSPMAMPAMAPAPGGPGRAKRRAAPQKMMARAKSTGMMGKLKGMFGGVSKSAGPPPEPAAEMMAEMAEVALFHDQAKEALLGAESSDRLFDLLMTQRADGSFPLGNELRGWVTGQWDAIVEAGSNQGEALVATALVIRVLRAKAMDREDEWRQAVKKAEKWLAKQQGAAPDVSRFV